MIDVQQTGQKVPQFGTKLCLSKTQARNDLFQKFQISDGRRNFWILSKIGPVVAV